MRATKIVKTITRVRATVEFGTHKEDASHEINGTRGKIASQSSIENHMESASH